ncbi:MAG: aquaporin [Erysipelotrichales bacterium]|nr:aquaporin [Erysipelotrichales bacterium]
MKKQAFRGELAAEFLGSMFLVMAAVASMIMFAEVFETTKAVAVLANAVAVAFVLCALIEMFGSISGAHFNPVVTMIMLFEKKIGATKAALFTLFQFIGGITGTALSRLMFLDDVGSILAVSDNVRNDYVFFGEIFGTFILVLAILLLVKAGSNKISIIIGLLVGGQLMSTSSTMFANPQVTVARIFTDTTSGIRPIDGVIFIAMQIIGALLAYGVYRFFFAKKSYKMEENK